MRKEWIAWGLISALLLPLFVGADGGDSSSSILPPRFNAS